MEGLLKYNYATADATGVAHDNIDKLLARNREETARSIGAIGPTPFIDTAEGQQTLLDMVTGGPGGAIGRVSKAAVTGGQLSRAGKPGKDFYHRLLKDMSGKEFVQRADWDKRLNNARKLMEKALNKWGGIKHNQTVNDPITENLRALKYRKN